MTDHIGGAATNDHDLLIEVNANVKNLTATLHQYTSAANQTITDHESRLRVLENNQTTYMSEIKGAQDSQKRALLFISIVGGIASTVSIVLSLLRS